MDKWDGDGQIFSELLQHLLAKSHQTKANHPLDNLSKPSRIYPWRHRQTQTTLALSLQQRIQVSKLLKLTQIDISHCFFPVPPLRSFKVDQILAFDCEVIDDFGYRGKAGKVTSGNTVQTKSPNDSFRDWTGPAVHISSASTGCVPITRHIVFTDGTTRMLGFAPWNNTMRPIGLIFQWEDGSLRYFRLVFF